jgi:hypothetical protein
VHNQADVNRLGGGHYLGKTYKGYVVNGSGKESGFSGEKNGSVFLSDNLPGIDVVASMPRSAGVYGPHIPTNKEVIITTLFAATSPIGREGGEIAGLLNMGDTTLASMESKALIKGGVNVLAQTLDNKIVHPHQSWANSAENVNIISAVFSTLGVNFLTNAVYSANFNLNMENGFQSTFNGGIGTNQSAKAIVGGTVIGGIEGTVKASPEEYPGIVNYGTQFLSTVTEVELGF